MTLEQYLQDLKARANRERVNRKKFGPDEQYILGVCDGRTTLMESVIYNLEDILEEEKRTLHTHTMIDPNTKRIGNLEQRLETLEKWRINVMGKVDCDD